jgi:hypothetical protein
VAFYRDILHYHPEHMERQSPLRWLMTREGQAHVLKGPFKLDADRRRCASKLWCLACVRPGLCVDFPGGASALCPCPSTCPQASAAFANFNSRQVLCSLRGFPCIWRSL